MKFFTLLLFLLVFNATYFASSKNDSTKALISYKLDEPLILDGVLSEPVYSKQPITAFTQKDPDEGKFATEKSEVWISHDADNIYFSGRFYDSNPDSIDVTLMRRDNFIESDWFWIYLDPYNDDRTGFYFAVNPGGSIADGTLFNDGGMDESWDGIWQSKTTVDESGWNLEVRIPFTQLRFKDAEKMIWGVNLNRDIKRKHEMSFYVLVPKKESGFVSKFADLIGLDGIKAKHRFEILPYFVQKAQYLVHDVNDPFYKSNQYKTSVGADIKFSIGSNLNVDATINPDFGQVEVDPAIINLSEFETFYNEKRPFFIEGGNIFSFGYGGANNNWGFNFGVPELIYSRRIGRSPQGNVTKNGYVDYPNETRILGAAKLTGKIDETWSIGALSSLTERTYATLRQEISDTSIEVEPFTHYGIFRTQKEFNSGKQAIGIIFTSVNRDLSNENLKNLLSNQAYTFGTDGWTFLDDDETYVVTGSVIGSYTSGTKKYLKRLQEQPYRYMQRPDKTYMPIDTNRTSIAGYFARVSLNKQKGNFYVNAAIGIISPGFEYNDLGSQWFADRINGHLVTGYRWFDPDDIFRRKSVYLAYNRTSDFENNIERSGFYLTSSAQFLNYWGINAQVSNNFKSVSKSLTRGGPKLNIPSNYSFNISAYTDSREKIIVSPGIGYWRNEIGSNEFATEIEIEWKPSSRISFSFGPEYATNNTSFQWVRDISDQTAVRTYNTRYVFADLDQKTFSANIRLNWIFTPTLSLQLYIQPLISVGDYENFKEIINPPTLEVKQYGLEGSQISYDTESENYSVDPDAEGPAPSFDFHNPDFNFKSLRGNLVLRWEALPGSVFYFAWTNSRMNFENPGEFNFKNDFSSLLKSETDNIFLVKFSYWIDI
ncbi:MAG: carbohydrate binding family 9 domain-containing protein [Ignavibacteriales bacterium]|nr:carbohydrate binding family 9 domain-containing protein [Ignavibacteriales bacterium]